MDFITIQADITTIVCDAIVLPANQYLKEKGSLSSAIFEKAGREKLTNACSKIEHCEVGHVVPTLAFNLDAKYIIHAVVPKWVDGNHSEYELLSSVYLEALTIADIMGCESIAFPLLASGYNSFDRSLAFEIAKKNIELYTGINLKKIVLVVYDEKSISLVKESGETVINLPEIIKLTKKEEKPQAKPKEIAQEGIKAAFDFLKDDRKRDKLVKDAQKAYVFAKDAYKVVKKVEKAFKNN